MGGKWEFELCPSWVRVLESQWLYALSLGRRLGGCLALAAEALSGGYLDYNFGLKLQITLGEGGISLLFVWGVAASLHVCCPMPTMGSFQTAVTSKLLVTNNK